MARDEDLDLLKAIRLCAFGAVKDREPDYILRYIFRAYSEFAHTPLHVVEELPLEYVLTNFFEHRYENMGDAEREEEEARLRETREERLAREKEEAEKKAVTDADDEEFFKQAQARAAEAERLRQAALAATSRGGLPEPAQVKPFQAPPPKPHPKDGAPPVTLTNNDKPATLPENVTIKFMDEGELGDLDEWDVMGPPPPGRK